uniref:Uncharacterized protein n=1 Tax=Sinocyclocheilus grahami TaxID=75366 RepID=A0A672MK95_SINGR
LFGIDAPTPTELTGLRKHFNSYILQGRRNVRSLRISAVYMLRRSMKEEHKTASASS